MPKTVIVSYQSPELRDKIEEALTKHIKEHFTMIETVEDIIENFEPYVHKFEPYYDNLFEEEIRDNKREINLQARRKQWTGKQFKQKNNRRQNRITYNHGRYTKS